LSKISFDRLLETKPIEYISYLEKLSTKEWSDKRDTIIERDKFTCKKCNLKATEFKNGLMYRDKTENEVNEYKKHIANSWYDSVLPEYKNKYDRDILPDFLKNLIIKPEQIILQVHHNYYILDKLPWDYPNESLVTLCIDCHQKVHDKSDIPIFSDETMSVKLDYTKCGTCNGSGYRPEYHYYMNGVCFDCNGNRYIELN
jgi:5-methylcytosine-specific restriction endonuclease McrA